MNGIIEHLGNKPMATLSIHRHEKSRFPSYYLWPPPVKVSFLLLDSCSSLIIRPPVPHKNHFLVFCKKKLDTCCSQHHYEQEPACQPAVYHL